MIEAGFMQGLDSRKVYGKTLTGFRVQGFTIGVILVNRDPQAGLERAMRPSARRTSQLHRIKQ